MCERRIGFFSLNFLHFSETFSISLIGMSELLSRSAVLADYFFHNAFRHASESRESGSLLVPRSEELPAFAIDEADFAEVTITSLFPESLTARQLGSSSSAQGSGEFSFQFEGRNAWISFDRSL